MATTANSFVQIPYIRELRALALWKVGRWQDALQELDALLQSHGGTSETYRLLGRIYLAAAENKVDVTATRYREKALDAYLAGLKSDPEDYYLGTAALGLMERLGKRHSERERIIALSKHSIQRRLQFGSPDAWDIVALLSLSVLSRDQQTAKELVHTLLSRPDLQEVHLRTLVDDMRRAAATENSKWLQQLISTLTENADRLRTSAPHRAM